MARVLVLGMAVMDFVFSVDEMPNSPTKHRAEAAEAIVGGGASNAAIAIARLGAQAALAGRLGDDALADLILADLAAQGVETELFHCAPGGRSSFSSVFVDRTGERQIVNFRGSGLRADADWIAETPRADAVLVDDRWSEGAIAALEKAREWGVPGIVDAEGPFGKGVLMAGSHIAFSRPGLLSISDVPELPVALAQFARATSKWACVTDGANGVWHTTPSGVEHVSACPIDAVDTLAAGDVWHGAFTLALAEGRAEPDAILFANAAAALKCQTFGGARGAPDRAAVHHFLEENST